MCNSVQTFAGDLAYLNFFYVVLQNVIVCFYSGVVLILFILRTMYFFYFPILFMGAM